VRTIRHEARAAEAHDLACEKWERADEVWKAMEWTLSRDPTAGRAITESGNVRSYVIQGARSAGWPTLTVIYQIEGDDLVIFEDAFFEEAGTYKPGYA
jgi:hypothetical protein